MGGISNSGLMSGARFDNSLTFRNKDTIIICQVLADLENYSMTFSVVIVNCSACCKHLFEIYLYSRSPTCDILLFVTHKSILKLRHWVFTNSVCVVRTFSLCYFERNKTLFGFDVFHKLAPHPRFERELTESKSVVLPLHQRGIIVIVSTRKMYFERVGLSYIPENNSMNKRNDIVYQYVTDSICHNDLISTIPR